ncbi:MAG: hypothetical protein V3V01_11080 [Acidimicrobiales bacterium]
MDIDDAATTIVPANLSPVATYDPERRQSFEAHLRELADQLLAEGRSARVGPQIERRVASEADERSSFGAACELCKGGCCQSGAYNQAFIDAAMLELYLERNTESTANDAVAAYLGLLPDQAVEDSCVYHGATGCTLPREMRHHICNVTRCSALRDLEQGEQDGKTTAVALVVAPDRTTVNGVAIITPTRTQVTRLE